MFIGDMNKKREQAMAKVRNAIALHNGQTLLSTGITGDDARLAKAVCDAGSKCWSRTIRRWRWHADTEA